MSIESEVFKKSTADFEKLEKFGFKHVSGGYTYSETIMDGDFRAEVFVGDDGAVTGKVFDCASGEEYLPVHTMLHTGPFVGEVREAYTAVLEKIAGECFISEPFIYGQSNRIAQIIFERYGERPDYPFKMAQDYGVFRYPDNRKWYALIMAIERSKLDKDGKNDDSGTVEIANIKIDTEMRDALLR
ncbi:MAG: MmcQ family protein, partial [Clostridia bacterium]|nr:MmcQ family protein [Clostridia bacterium]